MGEEAPEEAPKLGKLTPLEKAEHLEGPKVGLPAAAGALGSLPSVNLRRRRRRRRVALPGGEQNRHACEREAAAHGGDGFERETGQGRSKDMGAAAAAAAAAAAPSLLRPLAQKVPCAGSTHARAHLTPPFLVHYVPLHPRHLFFRPRANDTPTRMHARRKGRLAKAVR